MGKASRDKGLRRERAVAEVHAKCGIRAERVPLSGALRYRGNGADVDLYVRGPEPIKAEWKDPPELTIVSGSYVFMMFKRSLMDPDDKTKTYPAYWFDMVRVDNGLVQEHWDSAVKNPPAPR